MRRGVRGRRAPAPAAALVALAALGAAACSPSPTDPVQRQTAVLQDAGATDPSLLQLNAVVDMRGQAQVTIDTQDNTFGPQEVKVSPGTKVVWRNTGFNQHNVAPVVGGQFESIPTGSLDPGSSADRTLSTRGIYRYFCTIHGTAAKGQRGVIVVDDAS